jgi:hypothetical protein
MTFQEKCKQLEAKIIATYTTGVSLEDAEKLAAEFLAAQLMVSEELKKADLDCRMRKTGLKAIKARLYIDSTKGLEKKPTEKALESIQDSNEEILEIQNDYDSAEVEKASLERYYDVFANSHIFFRGVAKGSFGG